MRLGIAHHLGWAVAVTASADGQVVDRRRIDLIEPGLPTAPFEHESQGLDDTAAAELITTVRASLVRATSRSLDRLTADLAEAILSMSLRWWPPDFPHDVPARRRPPCSAAADSVLYREVLAELARERGWEVHLYQAKAVEKQAARALGTRADAVLHGPRTRLGPPWTSDHRIALAAAILARDS